MSCKEVWAQYASSTVGAIATSLPQLYGSKDREAGRFVLQVSVRVSFFRGSTNSSKESLYRRQHCCWEVDLREAPAVSMCRVGGDGRASQQVAEHREWDLQGARFISSDDSQQPAADDVPGSSALVIHFPDIFMYEPAQDTVTTSSSSPAQLKGNPCAGV